MKLGKNKCSHRNMNGMFRLIFNITDIWEGGGGGGGGGNSKIHLPKSM